MDGSFKAIEESLEESGLALSVCAGAILFLTLTKAVFQGLPHLKAICKTRCRAPCSDRTEEHIHRRICMEKMRLAPNLVWYILFWSCGGLLSYLIGQGNMKSLGGHWVSFLRTVIFLTVVQVPRLITPGRLNWIYIVLQVTVALDHCPWAIPAKHLIMMNYLGFIMLSLPASACAKNLAVVVIGQGGILVLVLVRGLTEFASDTNEEGTTSPLAGWVQWNIFFILCSVVLFSLVTTLIRQKVEQEIRQEDNKTQLSAASSLLNLTCDAVLELDESLRLMSPCPKLSTMLLGRPGATLEGTKFTDFVASSDAERAVEILLMPQECAAHAFHTHLVDSCSSKFRTEVFQVKYLTANGKQCHLLGLREFTDLKSLAGFNATDAIADIDSPHSVGSSHRVPSSGTSLFSLTSRPGLLKRKYRKNAFLVLDMEEQVVCSASAPFSQLTGQTLSGIFSSEVVGELMHFHEKAKSLTKKKFELELEEDDRDDLPGNDEFLPDETASFKRMPLMIASEKAEITGVAKVSLSRFGQLQVIVCCTPPPGRKPQRLAL